MVPEKYRLAAVGRYLLEAFERRRPAIKAWDAATEETLRAEAEVAIAQMQQQLHELGMDDPTYWVKLADAIRKVVIPRYLAMAREENERAAKDYGLWRGGDIVARATFAGIGLVLGAAAVAIPWIPVQEKWVPWMLFVGGPFVPDAYFWWYHRRYQRKIERLLGELAQAGESLETYRPLSEVQRTMEGPAEVAADERAPGGRTPTRG